MVVGVFYVGCCLCGFLDLCGICLRSVLVIRFCCFCVCCCVCVFVVSGCLFGFVDVLLIVFCIRWCFALCVCVWLFVLVLVGNVLYACSHSSVCCCVWFVCVVVLLWFGLLFACGLFVVLMLSLSMRCSEFV